MRILYLLPGCPFPQQWGPHVHDCALIEMGGAGAGVIGYADGPEEMLRWRAFGERYADIKLHRVLHRRVRGLGRFGDILGRFPATFAGYMDDGDLRIVSDICRAERYDVVAVNSYRLCRIIKAGLRIPVVLFPHDAYSMAYWRGAKFSPDPIERLRFWYASKCFARLEATYYPKFSVVAPVSAVDARWLQSRIDGVRSSVVGILVDPGIRQREIGASARSLRITCAGVYNNSEVVASLVDATRAGVHFLRARGVKYEWVIWGRGKAPRAISDVEEELREVRCLEWASDYWAEMRAGDMYIYPQRFGSGIQTKVQHAMLVGVPVVARAETLDAVGALNGVHAFAFDTYRELQAVIGKLTEDPGLRLSVGEAGRRMVCQRFGRDEIQRQFCAAVNAAIAAQKTGSTFRDCIL